MAVSAMKFSFLDLSELTKEYFGCEFLKDVAVIRSRMKEVHESLVFLEGLHPVLCDKLYIVRRLMLEEMRDVRFKYRHVKILLKFLDPSSNVDNHNRSGTGKGSQINQGRIVVIKMLRTSIREMENRYRSFAEGLLVKHREARNSKYTDLFDSALLAIRVMDSRKDEVQIVRNNIDRYEKFLKDRKDQNSSEVRKMVTDIFLKAVETNDYFLPGIAEVSHLISSNRFAEHEKRVRYYKNTVARINHAVSSNRFAKRANYDIFVKCLAAVGNMYITLFDWGEPVLEWGIS
ncbi:hypothetical protein M6B38_193485 [Iris pallida]|uniref:Uncharacterized protein n=1 Tax=Iris pallida TaxID=29817 RepID=A0AAX6DI19_IRIPA|nr:hypothetical protein M6B38_244605 [Iris pallida]KAJ6802482.1 hypothetical protein M6B38_193485 [Iris pallida]